MSGRGLKGRTYEDIHGVENAGVLRMARRNHRHRDEVRERIRLSKVGVPRPMYVKCKVSKSLSGRRLSESHKKNIGLGGSGKVLSADTRRKISVVRCRQWQDPEYAHKVSLSLARSPNKPEILLDLHLSEWYPGEYRYVGDGVNREDRVWFGGKNPDFMNVNGKKKLIELYGDHWHDGKKFPKGMPPKERIAHFRKYGFETLVIWENELRDLEKLRVRVCRFQDRLHE